MVEVAGDSAQRPLAPRDVQPVGPFFHHRAHGLGGFHKADVALNGVRAHAFNANARTRNDGAQANKVAGRRSVRFHVDAERRLVAAALGNDKSAVRFAAHRNAKARQQIERDVDVGLADELAHHLNGDVLVLRHQRQRHEQCSQKLAGHVAAHLNGRLQLERGFANVQRRKALDAQVINIAAQQPQRVYQIANGPLVHAGNARECVVAPQHGQCGGERTHGGAGVAHEKRNRRINLGAPTQPGDGHRVGLHVHAAAQLAQRGEHDLGVVRVE